MDDFVQTSLDLLDESFQHDFYRASQFLIIDDRPLQAFGLKTLLQRCNEQAQILLTDDLEEAKLLIRDRPNSLSAQAGVDLVFAYFGTEPKRCLEKLTLLHKTFPTLAIAALTETKTPLGLRSDDVLPYIEAGAVGYLPSDLPLNDLQDAIKTILQGEIYIPRRLLEQGQSLPDVLNHQQGRTPNITSNPFTAITAYTSRQYLKSLSKEVATPRLSIKPRTINSNPNASMKPPNEGIVTGDELGLTDRQIDVLELILRGYSNKLICRELQLAEGTIKVHVSAVLRSLGAKTRTQAVVAAAAMGIVAR